jgi:hypothetical protein
VYIDKNLAVSVGYPSIRKRRCGVPQDPGAKNRDLGHPAILYRACLALLASSPEHMPQAKSSSLTPQKARGFGMTAGRKHRKSTKPDGFWQVALHSWTGLKSKYARFMLPLVKMCMVRTLLPLVRGSLKSCEARFQWCH